MFRNVSDVAQSSGVDLGEMMFALTRLRRENDVLLAEIARGQGLHTTDFRALAFLRVRSDPTPRELSDYLVHSMSTTTATIDRLVGAGYVSRLPNPTDGRSVRLRATPKGAAAVDEAIGIYDAAFAQAIPEQFHPEIAAAMLSIADAFAAFAGARGESTRSSG